MPFQPGVLAGADKIEQERMEQAVQEDGAVLLSPPHPRAAKPRMTDAAKATSLRHTTPMYPSFVAIARNNGYF
jgi:hypothetical protein